MHDATLFIGMIYSNKSLLHFLHMYSVDVGIENLLDSASTTTVLSKYQNISFMATCTQTVICQCGTLDCIICGKITCCIV